MNPIGIAVIGAGGISEAHLYAYQRLDEQARLVAVVDIDGTRAQRAAKRFGVETTYAEYGDALARDDVAAVSICTPPFTHAPIAVDALRAGKHVLCEKPVALTLAELDAIAAAERDSGRLFSGVFQLRFGRGAHQLRALVDEGKFGRLHLGIAETFWFRDHDYYDVSWRGRWQSEGGGVTVSQAIHVVDALVWLLGEPVSVMAEAGAFRVKIEQEDTGVALIRFKNGAIGQITSTVNAFGEQRSRLEIYGTDLCAVSAAPTTEPTKEPFRLFSPAQDDADRLAQEMDERFPRGYRVLHRGPVTDFVEAVRDSRPPLVGIDDCRTALQVTTAIYKSAMTGARVDLPIAPDDPWYSAVPPDGFALPTT